MTKSTHQPETMRLTKARLSSTNLAREIEQLSPELSAHREPRVVLDRLARRLARRYGIPTCGIWLIDEASGALKLRTVAGKFRLPARLAAAHSVQKWLERTLEQCLSQVALKGDTAPVELVNWARDRGLDSVVAFPIAHDSRARGVLLIGSAEPLPQSALALLRLHARLGSVALDNAQLLFTAQRALSKLSFLVEASKALGSTLDLSELLHRILDVAKSQVEAERGTLFLVDEKRSEIWSLIAHGMEKQEIRIPLDRGITGHVARTGEIVSSSDAYADPRFNPEVDKWTGYRTRSILCLPIRNKSGKVFAVLQLLNKARGPFTDEDADFLLTLSGHISVALENAQLHKALLDHERMERELALARGIQRSLMPERPPIIDGFDIALLNEPCYAVGGDYYDFFRLGPQTLLFVIADVEGKGVGSALIMSNLQATLRALVLQLHSLNEIAETLNQMMLNDTRGEKYLSIFFGLIDARRKGVHYINCGHPPPVIVRPGNKSIPLTEGGMVIGLFEDAKYGRGQEHLESGDVLLLCTDGILESMNKNHEEYGTDRLVGCVQQHAHRKAEEIVEEVGNDVVRFSRHGTHVDDKVLIAIKLT